MSWSCSNSCSVSRSASRHSPTNRVVVAVGRNHSTPVLNCMCQHPSFCRSSLWDRQSVLTATSESVATRSVLKNGRGSLSHTVSTSLTNTSCPFRNRYRRNAAFNAPICWNAFPRIVTFAFGSCNGCPPVAITANVYRKSASEWNGMPLERHSFSVSSSSAATITLSTRNLPATWPYQFNANSWNPFETNVANTGRSVDNASAVPATRVPALAIAAAAAVSAACVLPSTSGRAVTDPGRVGARGASDDDETEPKTPSARSSPASVASDRVASARGPSRPREPCCRGPKRACAPRPCAAPAEPLEGAGSPEALEVGEEKRIANRRAPNAAHRSTPAKSASRRLLRRRRAI